MELLDRLNDPNTSAAVHTLVDRLTELHKVGALDTVCDLAMTLHAVRNALTDNMVERLFMFAENMINTVGNEAVGELAENARMALEDAAQETAKGAGSPRRRDVDVVAAFQAGDPAQSCLPACI